MPASKSLQAYAEITELLDRAFASQRGVAVKFDTVGMAVNFHQRLNSFRKLDRERNKSIYPEDNPMYGRTVYDGLLFKREEETPDEVHILPVTIGASEIREL